MKKNFYTMKQQTQDFVLRLFVESVSSTPASYDYCTCAHVGTHARLYQ